MLFWLTLVVTIGLFYLLYKTDADWAFYLSVIFAIILGVMILIIALARSTEDGYAASNRERYKALVYKAEAEETRDDFGIVNKEYIDEVQAWNEDVARGKAMQDNF